MFVGFFFGLDVEDSNHTMLRICNVNVYGG